MHCIVAGKKTIFVITNTINKDQMRSAYQKIGKTLKNKAMNTNLIFKRSLMVLVLGTFFVGTQSFVQDDTMMVEQKPVQTDTLACCERMPATTEMMEKKDDGKTIKVSFPTQQLAAADAKVYELFIQSNKTVDFSFLKQLNLKGDQAVMAKFEAEFAPKVSFSSTQAAEADAAILAQFNQAHPAVQLVWNTASLETADQNMITRFQKENGVYPTIPSVSKAALIASDIAMEQRFLLENGLEAGKINPVMVNNN
jgi:hypothetical protein